MSNEIREQVAAILEQAGVKFKTSYRGEKSDALDGKHAMDEWLVSFHMSERESRSFEYFTGLGHRKPKRSPYSWEAGKNGPITVARRVKENSEPVAPHAADVLYSLILDGEADNMTFSEWCNEFGYDIDSTKADRIFDACRENARKLRNVFTRDTLTKLGELLQDY